MKPIIYTTKDLATILGVSDETVRREIKRGRLKCFYVGDQARFTQVHIEDYMNVKDFGMTTREIELEKEKKQLLEVIAEKDRTIKEIKNFILKEV
ncbi:helix-turn-helix domain-containing protein [Paratissierella segnis]|uniref:Helix-turn-helix domain-containing protein n=1 Tax=Paratissierella segnis TaxID=2763679 RepID=A0A926EXI4_9FIRM|nr:helix-turn-helix domain-containing protein [Paratissierella segnis]MBC8589367.1 helix-turn-helix domain-containing protein [Paratissierella segnis]